MGRNFGEWDKRFDALIKGIRWWGFIMAVLLLVILIWGV
jgi:cell division protein FtsX